MDFNRKRPKSKTEQGDRAEKGVLRKIHQVHRSGAGRTKGDIHTPEDHVEVKSTASRSFSVTRKLWEKVRNQALKSKRSPVLVIDFEEGPTLVVREGFDGE